MKKHVKYPMYLFSKTQQQQKWCKELIHTRGMVVDEDGQIIARPLTKFFKLTEITGWDELHEQEYGTRDIRRVLRHQTWTLSVVSQLTVKKQVTQMFL